MKQIIKFIFLLSLPFLLTGCSILPGRKKSALSILTTPQATVFLDGEHLGSTPYYNEKIKSGQYVLKIVPESTGQALNPWEGRVTLSPGILTVVKRELSLTVDSSSGEIISFEPLADKNSITISVVTTPDGAVVNLDGEPRGFAPLSIDSVSEGDHVLVITSPGFQQKTIKAKTIKGNKLIVSVQLAREEITPVEEKTEEEATPSATPKTTPSPNSKSTPTPSGPSVKITSEVGWARVRVEASTGSKELGKVDLGDEFPLLETVTVDGFDWYKIEFEAGNEGWIREDLAEKL